LNENELWQQLETLLMIPNSSHDPPPELWQLETLLGLVGEMSRSEVDLLMEDVFFSFWTISYQRMADLLDFFDPGGEELQ
jgi:hypothetical protein